MAKYKILMSGKKTLATAAALLQDQSNRTEVVQAALPAEAAAAAARCRSSKQQ